MGQSDILTIDEFFLSEILKEDTMHYKKIAAAAALAFMFTAPASAAPVNLNFSFGSGSGTFLGLDDSDGIQAATGYVFDGAEDSYTVSSVTGSGFFGTPANSFEFLNGNLISIAFLDSPFASGSENITTLFQLELEADLSIGSQPFGSSWEEGSVVIGGTSGSATLAIVPLSAVPLPAGGLLLLTGLGGLLASRRWKSSSA